MKKLGIIIAALFAVVAFSTASFADVQVTLTSPTIIKDGCERAGAVEFSFPAGTTFTAGDWWYMDISTSNVTICEPINYLIGAPGSLNAGAGVDLSLGVELAVGMVGPTLAAPPTYGPISYNSTTAVTVAPGGDSLTMGFLVTAVKDSNRVLLEVVGTAPGQTYTIPAEHTLKIKVMDGKKWNDITTAATDTLIFTNVFDNVAGDVDYGEANIAGTATDLIDLSDNDVDGDIEEPAAENTLCINAEDAPGNIVFTSYASKLDFLTFTGDSQIAHTGSATAITFESCSKIAVDTRIEAGGQGTCGINYKTGGGYCDNTGESVVMQTAGSTFGQSGDKYDIAFHMLTAGVYFGAPTALEGYYASEDACDDNAPNGNFTPAYTLWAGTDDTVTGWGDTSCAVDADDRIDSLTTSGGAVLDLWKYNSVDIDFGTLIYDNTIVGNGEVQIQVVISKYPCGEFLDETITIGTFVEACDTAVTSTTLVFPYFPPLDGSAIGWWAGYVITNAGTDTGNISLVYSDADGNTGTYETTEAVAAGAMFNGTMITAADLSDADDYNASANYSIVATCEFGGAVGFAFIGNGNEGTGYAID
jgi:hypothetical protein